MKGKRGFTLLEVMVATLIMAVAIVSLLSTISGATRNASRLREYNRVTQLAQLRMNELLADWNTPLNATQEGEFEPNLTGGLKMGWRSRLTNFEMGPNPAQGQLVLDRLELEVWWTAGTNRRSIRMEGFRQRAIGAGEVPQ